MKKILGVLIILLWSSVCFGGAGDPVLYGSKFIFNAASYTGTDTAKIQAAVTAAVAVGGVAYIPKGTWSLTDESPGDNHCILVSGQCTIIGAAQQGTTVRTNDNNADVFYINTTAAVDISNMTIENNSGSATWGAYGITATSSTNNNYSTFDNLVLKNHKIGIALENATFCTITDCIFSSSGAYGILISNTYSVDSASHYIAGNLLTGAVDSQIRIESGGGTRLVGNNIHLGAYGLDVAVKNGTTTSVLIVDANKFEAQSTNSIRITNYSGGTTGVYEKIVISDNVFCEDCYGSTSTGMSIDGYNDNTFSTITVTGNVMHGGGIDVGDCSDIIIANNVIEKQTVSRTYGINFTAAPGGLVNVFGNQIIGWAAANEIGGTAFQSTFKLQSSGIAIVYSDSGSGSESYFTLREAGTTKAYLSWNNTNTLLWTSSGDILLQPNGGTVAVTGDVTTTGSCSDYVFEPDYGLMSLDGLQGYIDKEGHLPDMTVNNPEDGMMNLGGGIIELVVKTEEQALYILQLHDRLKVLEEGLTKLVGDK